MSAVDNREIIKESDERIRAWFAPEPIRCFPGTGRIDPRTMPSLMDSLATSSHPSAPLLTGLVNDMIQRFGGDE